MTVAKKRISSCLINIEFFPFFSFEFCTLIIHYRTKKKKKKKKRKTNKQKNQTEEKTEQFFFIIATNFNEISMV